MAHDHHPANTPCSPQETAVFLQEAEAHVAARGQKLTPIRRKVLELLLESAAPAKAYDLLELLDGEGSAKPPTVYRALDFLLDTGLAHKIQSLNAYVACGHTSHSHTAAFLICQSCGSATELHANQTIAALHKEAQATKFVPENTVIEVRGTCVECHE